jgi:hypothetical protein
MSDIPVTVQFAAKPPRQVSNGHQAADGAPERGEICKLAMN